MVRRSAATAGPRHGPDPPLPNRFHLLLNIELSGVVQWTRIEGSMAELLQQGYRPVSVNQFVTCPPVQDAVTTYHLSRGADLLRCQEGARLVSDRWRVTSCWRIARPHEINDNGNRPASARVRTFAVLLKNSLKIA